MRHYELLVAGKTVPVVGETPLDAVDRYVREHPAAVVEAWRVPQHGVYTLGRSRIVEPGDE